MQAPQPPPSAYGNYPAYAPQNYGAPPAAYPGVPLMPSSVAAFQPNPPMVPVPTAVGMPTAGVSALGGQGQYYDQGFPATLAPNATQVVADPRHLMNLTSLMPASWRVPAGVTAAGPACGCGVATCAGNCGVPIRACGAPCGCGVAGCAGGCGAGSDWSRYAPDREGFNRYITAQGSARLQVQSRGLGAPNARVVGAVTGANFLRQRPVQPLSNSFMLFNDSSARADSAANATGVYNTWACC